MADLINAAIAKALDGMLRIFLLPGLRSPRIYALRGVSAIQPLLERLARHRAVAVFRRARAGCPAYASFLDAHGYTATPTIHTFGQVPETRKDTYVKPYSIEQRCMNARIPSRGVVIDESSGSGGTPTAWVRGPDERAGVRRMLLHGFAARFGDSQLFLLNCFALGPWATGMNVTMSLADSVISQSIGPDKAKLEHTLRTFGDRYTYAVAGYPPFIRDFLATTTMDLSTFRLHLLVGGEGISEGHRDEFLKVFQSVFSSYGASDLEINLAAETPFTIAVRRMCDQDPSLCRSLFGRDDPPMLFQYDALNYLIETNADKELVFTLLRRGFAAPKVRYNLRDVGGSLPARTLLAQLRERGINTASLPPMLAFPILYVYGRSDLTLPFYGAKIFAADIASAIAKLPDLAPAIHSFQMRRATDAAGRDLLVISLELIAGQSREHNSEKFDVLALRDALLSALRGINQDFREVSKMFTAEQVLVELHALNQGPFAGRDIRVKNRYVAS